MAALASVYVEVLPKTDQFSPQLKRQIGKVDASAEAKKTGSKWGSAFSAAATSFAALAIVKFGKDSVAAFKESETAQARLSDAFTRFPKLANVSIESLQQLNTELGRKTKFDDDATASGQAVLAQFKLTGSQIRELTPLLQDYAAKTGKDLPTAAQDLGKAMLGQGRSLKAVGINFKDSGTAGGNFNQIMTGLRQQVGGFAEKEGKTAAGQSEILKNQFGELQETAGAKLLPALSRLATVLLRVVDFVSRNQKVVVPLVAVFGTLVGVVFVITKAVQAYTAVQAALNVVLTANPIGLVIAALALLVLGTVIAWKRSETFRNVVKGSFAAVADAGRSMWENVLRPVFKFLTDAWFTVAGAIVNGAAKAFGWVPGIGPKLKAAAKEFNGFRDRVNDALSGVKSRNITVTARASVLQGQGLSRRDALETTLGRAAGGPAFGPGTGTSDSIPARLSNGEHVLTAREVSAMGGHSAVGRMRKAALAGQVAAFAGGGPVGFSVTPRLDGLAGFSAAIAAFNRQADQVATAAAQRAVTSSGFSANLAGVVRFAQAQAGKPYVWGSGGPGGFDCSGFVSALVNVAQGRAPFGRRFSTGTLPAGLFDSGNGAFRIGWFTGNPGHVAATVNGVAMESRGGDGVVVGSRSRGADQGIFNRHGHLRGFARGGPVLPGDPPFDLLDPGGLHYRAGLREALQGAGRMTVQTLDSGGYVMPGLNLIRNGTGRPERTRTGAQEDGLLAELQGLRRDLAAIPVARVDGRVIKREYDSQTTRNPSGW